MCKKNLLKDTNCLYARFISLTGVIQVGKDNQILIPFIPLKGQNKSEQLRYTSRGPEIRAVFSTTKHFSTARVEYAIILTP